MLAVPSKWKRIRLRDGRTGGEWFRGEDKGREREEEKGKRREMWRK